MKTRGRVACSIAVVVWMGAGFAEAGFLLQKKAKEAGYPATNCQYCHSEKLPKKDNVALNARGKWLESERDKRKAKEVDVQWLKDYAEPKEAAK